MDYFGWTSEIFWMLAALSFGEQLICLQDYGIAKE